MRQIIIKLGQLTNSEWVCLLEKGIWRQTRRLKAQITLQRAVTHTDQSATLTHL